MTLTTAGARVDEHYDSRTIALHWATAALVVLAWGMAQIIDDFPRGALRVDARSVHITFGIALAVVLAMRIVYRASAGRGLPAADKGLLHLAAKATHWGLYLLLTAQVLLGITLWYMRGDSYFNVFALPGSADKDLRNTIDDLHGTIANIILIVAGIHAAAALVHHFVFRDNVLRRMAPVLPRQATPDR